MKELYIIKGPHIKDGEKDPAALLRGMQNLDIQHSIAGILTREKKANCHFYEGMTKGDADFYDHATDVCAESGIPEEMLSDEKFKAILIYIKHLTDLKKDGYPVDICPTERDDFADNDALIREVFKRETGKDLEEFVKGKVFQNTPAYAPYLIKGLGEKLLELRDEAIFNNINEHGDEDSVLIIGAYHTLPLFQSEQHPFNLWNIELDNPFQIKGDMPKSTEDSMNRLVKDYKKQGLELSLNYR